MRNLTRRIYDMLATIPAGVDLELEDNLRCCLRESCSFEAAKKVESILNRYIVNPRYEWEFEILSEWTQIPVCDLKTRLL